MQSRTCNYGLIYEIIIVNLDIVEPIFIDSVFKGEINDVMCIFCLKAFLKYYLLIPYLGLCKIRRIGLNSGPKISTGQIIYNAVKVAVTTKITNCRAQYSWYYMGQT